jgi:hypothetical protein
MFCDFFGTYTCGLLTPMGMCYLKKKKDSDSLGMESGGRKIFHTHPHWPWDPSSLLYNGYCVPFLGVK